MLRAGNRIDLLENGAAYFPALIAAIETAERELGRNGSVGWRHQDFLQPFRFTRVTVPAGSIRWLFLTTEPIDLDQLHSRFNQSAAQQDSLAELSPPLTIADRVGFLIEIEGLP